MDFYLGMIIPFAGDYAPDGWLICQGQTLQIQQYAALYSIMGIKYGGDGHTNFKLPDLRGRAMLGYGISPASGLPYQMGQFGGTETVSLGVANLPPHNHAANFTGAPSPGTISNGSISNGTCNVTVTMPKNAVSTSGSGTNSTPQDGYYFGDASVDGVGDKVNLYSNATPNVTLGSTTATGTGTVSGTVSGNVSVTPAGTVAVGNTGNGTAFSNMQPYQVVNFIICTNGIYPSRP